MGPWVLVLVLFFLQYVCYVFFCATEMFYKQMYTFMDIYKYPLWIYAKISWSDPRIWMRRIQNKHLSNSYYVWVTVFLH